VQCTQEERTAHKEHVEAKSKNGSVIRTNIGSRTKLGGEVLPEQNKNIKHITCEELGSSLLKPTKKTSPNGREEGTDSERVQIQNKALRGALTDKAGHAR